MTRPDHAVYVDDGCRLWVAEEGRGWPLICCHGGPGPAGHVRASSAGCCGITCAGINVDRDSPQEGASGPR